MSDLSQLHTRQPELDRVQGNVAEALRRAAKSLLARGLLAIGVEYVRASLTIRPGQQSVVWTGSSGTITLPAVAALGQNQTQHVFVRNDGTGVLKVRAVTSETIGPGLAVVSLGPGQGADFFGDGLERWALLGPPGAPQTDFRHTGGASLEAWYYANCDNGAALGTAALVANTLYAMPFVAPQRGGKLDRIAANVTAALGNIRVGLYENTNPTTTLYPGKLVSATDSGSLTGTGRKEFTVATLLTPGALYWLVIASDNTPTVRTLTVGNVSHILGTDNTLGTAPNAGISVAFTYGALPLTFPGGGALFTAAPIPALAMRFSE